MSTKESVLTYPGSGSYYVICDICGIKIRRNQATLVVNKFSPHKNLLVCHRDLDYNNDKDRPIVARETLMPDPKYVRQEVADTYALNANSDRLPGKPTLLTATQHPLNDTVMLTWFGPEDGGSDRIIGYQITRAEPQLSTDIVIVANTGSDATYYEDVTSDTANMYTYTVSAITELGVGSVSAYGFYPVNRVSAGVSYISDGTGVVIKDGIGGYLLDGSSI